MPALIPAPTTSTWSNRRTAEITSLEVQADDPTLQTAVQGFVDSQLSDGPWRATGRSRDERPFPVRVVRAAVEDVALSVGLNPMGGEPDDERYTLVITADAIEVRGATPVSIFRALTSLRQLVDEEVASAGAGAFSLPQVVIEDGPRFAWRGLSLSTLYAGSTRSMR